jgi:hypothetical protein
MPNSVMLQMYKVKSMYEFIMNSRRNFDTKVLFCIWENYSYFKMLIEIQMELEMESSES